MMLDTGYWIRDTGYGMMRDTGCWICTDMLHDNFALFAFFVALRETRENYL
jgi:hypothetical protein